LVTGGGGLPLCFDSKHGTEKSDARIVQYAANAVLENAMRIPVMWAGNSGDVGRRRSEATLVAFYSSQVAHMSQEKRKFSVH
jgi:hypothetical protein